MARVRYNGAWFDYFCPRLTELNGYRIGDMREAFWLNQPFLDRFQEVYGREILTMGDLRQWAADNRSRIARSVFRDFIRNYGHYENTNIPDSLPLLSFRAHPRDTQNSWSLVELCRPENRGYVDEIPIDGQPVGVAYDGVSCLFRASFMPIRSQVREGRYPPVTDGWWDPNSFYTRVNNYSFRPNYETCLTPKDSLDETFGMELEVSTILSIKELQWIVAQVEPKQEPFFFAKSDSSISGLYDNLYEIVTMPCSPRFLKRNFRILFDKLEKLAKEKGKRLSDVFDLGHSNPLNNGIHIHLGKTCFDLGPDGVLKFHQNRFLTVLNRMEPAMVDFLTKISKRPRRLTDLSYCIPHPGMRRSLVQHYKCGPDSAHRYSIAHDAGRTIEVRMFYGLMTLDHIIMCIEFCQAMLEFTQFSRFKNKKAEDIIADFLHWLKGQPGYRQLKKELL